MINMFYVSYNKMKKKEDKKKGGIGYLTSTLTLITYKKKIYDSYKCEKIGIILYKVMLNSPFFLTNEVKLPHLSRC